MEPLPGWESSPWSQAPTANTFRLGLCVFLLNFLSCVAVEPLCKEEEYSVGDHCCPMCNPGYYVKQACSNWTGIVCAPCPPQTYTAHSNGLSKCLPCGVCDPDMGLVTWQECSSRKDTVCRCNPGYFCETQEGDHCSTCSPHTNCSLGQRVLERALREPCAGRFQSRQTQASPQGNPASCQPEPRVFCLSLSDPQVRCMVSEGRTRDQQHRCHLLQVRAVLLCLSQPFWRYFGGCRNSCSLRYKKEITYQTGSQGRGALAEAGKRQHCQASCP
ncbi:tumor necrosis factor receptor superfamily member 14 isoform X2 [Microtus pennsylvanicus]|uniref:tumor necrosis factor receptor superfamily member 14 isoform X2 n=1 Tax=Microtus pennsylvanicus TaxID=10058 RepID=UPI003F6D9577